MLTLLGCGLWLRLGLELSQGAPGSGSPGSIGLILIVVGGYGLRVAHLLWGRLDFESTLVWLDFNGSYARAQVGLGSPFTDRVRSERSVVNVESMTLRGAGAFGDLQLPRRRRGQPHAGGHDGRHRRRPRLGPVGA